MALSRKLTAMDEQISCDQLYLSKVCVRQLFCYLNISVKCFELSVTCVHRPEERDKDTTSMTLMFHKSSTFKARQ